MTKQEIKKALTGHINTIRKDKNGEEYCIINLGFVNAPQNFAQFKQSELEKVTDLLNDLGYVPTLHTKTTCGYYEKSLKFYL